MPNGCWAHTSMPNGCWVLTQRASLPGFLHLQFLLAYSMQKWRVGLPCGAQMTSRIPDITPHSHSYPLLEKWTDRKGSIVHAFRGPCCQSLVHICTCDAKGRQNFTLKWNKPIKHASCRVFLSGTREQGYHQYGKYHSPPPHHHHQLRVTKKHPWYLHNDFFTCHLAIQQTNLSGNVILGR